MSLHALAIFGRVEYRSTQAPIRAAILDGDVPAATEIWVTAGAGPVFDAALAIARALGATVQLVTARGAPGFAHHCANAVDAGCQVQILRGSFDYCGEICIKGADGFIALAPWGDNTSRFTRTGLALRREAFRAVQSGNSITVSSYYASALSKRGGLNAGV